MLGLLAMAPQDLARTEAKERSTSDGRYLLGAADRCIVARPSRALCPLHDCLQSLQSLEQSRDLRSADGWGNKGHRPRGSIGRSQHDHWKPSITKCWPVMKQGSEVARKATSWATSAGVPRRFSMMPFFISSPRDLVRLLPSSVSITPGQMALIMIFGPSSLASARVRPRMPALAEA